jgi:hypothetical protein
MDAESRRDFAAASNWWRRLLGLDALKTRAVLGLMEALVALGDRAEALRTAERYAQRVREDLDGEPNARIMSYASSLRGTPSRLPVIADEMIGRDDELRVATSLIERSDLSLLTLTGAGGTGKTRLAIQVARAVEPRVDRVWFVDLSALRDSAGVIPAVASACGVQPEPGRDPVDGIASSLAGRRVLIVLDNFEQVVDAAGAIARLVNAAPEAKLLVTSRMRLGIRAEHEFFVAPLALPEDPTNIGALRANSSVRLFLRRAAAANPSLVFDDETLGAAARICARVDGLPLAIELAAARCRLMSPRTIATRLESGLDLVSGGGRDMPGASTDDSRDGRLERCTVIRCRTTGVRALRRFCRGRIRCDSRVGLRRQRRLDVGARRTECFGGREPAHTRTCATRRSAPSHARDGARIRDGCFAALV